MSYREIRNFTSMMRTLGYPRLISMLNFRNPNFPLVAEILVWLVNRFESSTVIALEYETEQQRVKLIRTAAQFMATKANILLNTKRLYQADGYAVKELLKIASVLFEAFSNAPVDDDADLDESSSYVPIDITAKLEDIRRARQLASEITSKGASLYDLLGKEIELREHRSMGLARSVELGKAEQAMKAVVEETKKEMAKTRKQIEEVATTEATLDSKIEKKRLELERSHKRLQSLKQVRPAFMEEFERLEVELQALFGEYVVRHRTLTALEHMQQIAEQAEKQKALERLATTRKMLEAMQQEDGSLKFLDGTSIEGTGIFGNDDVRTSPLHGDALVVPTGPTMVAGRSRVFGSMSGGVEDEEDSASILGSDSDLLLGAGQDSELGSDDDDDLPLGEKITGSAAPGTSGMKPQELSDDDF